MAVGRGKGAGWEKAGESWLDRSGQPWVQPLPCVKTGRVARRGADTPE